MSIEVAGEIPPWWRIFAAGIGPLAGASIAGFLGAELGQPLLVAVAVLHATMIVPPFGDGRALVGAIRLPRSSGEDLPTG